MRYTRFGQTDSNVSRICFGTWQFSGEWGSTEERESTDAMRRALDLGVNFFDTAQAYGFGASEQLVGKALEPEIKNRREEIVLATKGGLRPEGGGVVRDASRDWLREGVEDSLRGCRATGMVERSDARRGKTFWAVDREASTAEFTVRFLAVARTSCVFGEVAGVFDEDDPSAASVEATIEVPSVDTGNETRDEHSPSARTSSRPGPSPRCASAARASSRPATVG